MNTVIPLHEPLLDDASAAAILCAQPQSELERVQRLLDLRTGALDSASTHFMITDVSVDGGAIVYVNRALARDHGYEPSELLGCDPAILMPRELNGCTDGSYCSRV